MKKIRLISILLVLVTVLFTACNHKTEFEKVEVTSTTVVTQETTTVKLSEFEYHNIRFGMSIVETQNAIGQMGDVGVSGSGVVYFTATIVGLPFVTEGTASSMYFIYDNDAHLCEMQYMSTSSTGFVLKNAISSLNSLYGKHCEVNAEDGKVNYVWYSKGAYIVITTAKNGTNAISYFSEEYFSKSNPEEVNAYKNAK